MSAYYRQKSLSQLCQTDFVVLTKEATRGTLGKFRLEGRTRKRGTKPLKVKAPWIEKPKKPRMTEEASLGITINPTLRIADGSLMDPFGVSALPLDGRMQRFVHHCALFKVN
jgi:hypothetical protein